MTTIPNFLVDHIVARDRERAERASALLDTLTDRERRIVEDAAVMGHQMGGPHGRRPVPPDSEIIAMVTTACPSIPTDLTPREKYLLHDAAVMGFVRGGLNGADLDAESIVQHVVECCQSMSDLYPVLGGDIQKMAMRIVRKHQPVRAGVLVTVVAELCAFDRETVSAMVADLVADNVLVEAADGLRVGDAT